MAAAVAWLLFFQLFLGPDLLISVDLKSASNSFRILHFDYPKVNFAAGFLGYCNGIMSQDAVGVQLAVAVRSLGQIPSPGWRPGPWLTPQ